MAKATKGNVWDLPLRLFHWLLVAAVIAAVVSVKAAGNMFVHEKAGLTIGALLVFRIIWGFTGSHHARFGNFLTPPGRIMPYIKKRLAGDRQYHPGHAPTGAWATLAILGVLLWMVGFGLMSHDDVLYNAPLAAMVGRGFSHFAHDMHHIGEKLVIAVIVLHIAAIIVYRVKLKINLLPPMLDGGTDPALPPISKSRQVAGVILLFALIGIAQALGTIGMETRFF